jgi:branched-chain amino acid transport system permease protein
MLTAPVMNRKPPFCAEALGFRTVTYRTVSIVLAALFVTVAGALLALWLRYTDPDTTLSFEIMLDILLIVVIGGMGTLYGEVIGSVLFVLSVCYFPSGVVGRLRARVKIR